MLVGLLGLELPGQLSLAVEHMDFHISPLERAAVRPGDSDDVLALRDDGHVRVGPAQLAAAVFRRVQRCRPGGDDLLRAFMKLIDDGLHGSEHQLRGEVIVEQLPEVGLVGEIVQPRLRFLKQLGQLCEVFVRLGGGIFAALDKADKHIHAVVAVGQLRGEELDLGIELRGGKRVFLDGLRRVCTVRIIELTLALQIHALQVVGLMHERAHIVRGKDGEKIHRIADVADFVAVTVGKRADFVRVGLGIPGFRGELHHAAVLRGDGQRVGQVERLRIAALAAQGGDFRAGNGRRARRQEQARKEREQQRKTVELVHQGQPPSQILFRFIR